MDLSSLDPTVTCPDCGAACYPPCICECGLGIPGDIELDWQRYRTDIENTPVETIVE